MEDDAARPEPAGLELPDLPTEEQAEQAERLVRQSVLAQQRDNKDLEEKLVSEALELAPGSSLVQEAKGDMLLHRKQTKAAKDAYHLAVKLDPANVTAERKYGECVLLLESSFNPDFSRAIDDSLVGGKAAVMLTMFLPGLGQIVCGRKIAGFSFMAIWLVGIVWAFMIPDGMSGLRSLFGRSSTPFNPLIMVPLFMVFAAWLAAVAEANSRVKTTKARVIDRPAPPVDKPFEL